jgi:hypothetical protein
MTPDKLRQRLEETDGRVDTREYVEALSYVRDDGRQ